MAAQEPTHFTFYTSSEYYQELTRRIRKTRPGDRVVLVSLWLLPGHSPIDDLLTAACAAAKRGVEVRLLVDAFTFLIKSGIVPGPAFFFGAEPRVMTRSFRLRLAAIRRLEAAGGHCLIINQPRRPLASPFEGRSHMKFSVINNEVFVGGCNLSDADHADLMVGWHDPHIAEWLYGFALDIMATGRVSTALRGQDVRLPVNKTTTLLVDAGIRRQSVIFDELLSLIDQAEKSLLITYQYFPHTITARHLLRAHQRGVELRIVYNHPGKHQRPLNLAYGLGAWKSRLGRPASFLSGRLPKEHPFLHDKLVASEKAAMLGSHNYMYNGVRWGTAEIALLNTDPRFAAEAVRTLERQLAQV